MAKREDQRFMFLSDEEGRELERAEREKRREDEKEESRYENPTQKRISEIYGAG